MKLNKIDKVWSSANSIFKWRFRFAVIQNFCNHGNVTQRLLSIAIVVFQNLLVLIVFQSLSLLFVIFKIMLGRHICVTRSCDFVIHKWFHNFHSQKRTCYWYNHNCNKILKSDWLSTALISALIGQFNRTVRVMPK